MSPILSPKKSVEGAIGGMLGAAVLAAVYSCLMRFTMTIPTETIVYVSIISAIAALVSMVGDLTASAIKRNYDIKDYGKIIPGHGGIMDRFDSVIFTAPMIYFLALFLVLFHIDNNIYLVIQYNHKFHLLILLIYHFCDRLYVLN